MRPSTLSALFFALPGLVMAALVAAQDLPADVQVLALPVTQAVEESDTGSVQFIGTATVLIRYRGLTILTDPNFLHKGDRANLGYGITTRRRTNPAIEFADLPPVDLVLLSHLHDDHFDQQVQQRLHRNIPIISTKESSARLGRLGFTRGIGLSEWETLEVQKGTTRLRITATPARHGPPGATLLLPTVMGSMLDFPQGPGGARYLMYISGDTLVYDELMDLPRRFPDIDLALLHLGGARAFGMVQLTMDGKDGVQLAQLLAPRKAIPLHFNDYDVFESPLSEFQAAVKAAGLDERIIYLKQGDSYSFERLGR